MGGCLSTNTVQDPRVAEVEKSLKEAEKEWVRQTKVLLLGTGDSGKSTILKQIQLINSIPFTPDEVESYRQLIFANLLTGIRRLHEIAQERNIRYSSEIEEILVRIMDTPDIKDRQAYPADYLSLFQQVWADSNIQTAVKYGKQMGLPDNVPYYFNNLPRLFDSSYVPTEQDIIHSRARTVGVHESRFTFKRQKVVMIDVGGQRSERRKWIHCFQDVTAILFLVSLSGYDQMMEEDKETNQMKDAMEVWNNVCSVHWFRNTSMILFLNKEDLFREKASYSSIKEHFPEYAGNEGDIKEGMQFFRRTFMKIHAQGTQELAAAKNSGSAPKLPDSPRSVEDRKLYPYFTTATDTNMVRNIMGFVNEIILAGNFADSRML